MITQVSDSLYSRLVQSFEDRKETDTRDLGPIREAAFGRFKAAGFPTVKNENWKYTNLSSLLRKDYQDAAESLDTLDTATLGSTLAEYAFPELDAYRIVLVNGRYDEGLSDQIDVTGVRVQPIGSVIGDPVFVRHFAGYADRTDSALVALNTALFDSGVFIHLSKNTVLDKPIHIVRISAGSDAVFSQSRSLYVLEAFAEAEIIESYVGQGVSEVNLSNLVTEVSLEENARLQHYQIQTALPHCGYISHIEVHQRRHSLYNHYNANFPGADFVRNDINVRMDDPQVESHLYGVLLLNGKQLVDNHTIVDHLKPHGESYEWYKTITQDESTAVFNGKIFVREDAQKTNAFQQNNNVLIGERSAVYSKPQLEIFADDVKCSHGCTMGQFDEEALFYLRARGIGEEQGRVLLVQAFAFDVTSRFDNEVVRQYVERLIEKHLD